MGAPFDRKSQQIYFNDFCSASRVGACFSPREAPDQARLRSPGTGGRAVLQPANPDREDLMQEHLYAVGQHVSYAEDGIAWPWRGGHEIMALLPVGGDEPKYQIRSADRSYDRVVQEHELAEDLSVPPLLRARAGGE
jgi:hypothetical protein